MSAAPPDGADEAAVRRWLLDLADQTGNDAYRKAAECLREEPLNLRERLLALAERPRGRGRPEGAEDDDDDALFQVAELVLRRRLSPSAACKIVAAQVPKKGTPESVRRRLLRKYRRDADLFVYLARLRIERERLERHLLPGAAKAFQQAQIVGAAAQLALDAARALPTDVGHQIERQQRELQSAADTALKRRKIPPE